MENAKHLGRESTNKESKSFSKYFEEHLRDDDYSRTPDGGSPFSNGILNNSSNSTDWMKSFEDFCKFCVIGAQYLSEKFKERKAKSASLRKYKRN